MSQLDRAAAKMFVVGFDGTEVPPSMRDLIRRGVSGAVLFARNLGQVAQIKSLNAELKRTANRPFLISIDHEGGRIVRSREGFTPIPPMREVGAAGDVDRARQIGETMGRELRGVGFNVNFAPVMDVDTNPRNPVIGDRSFGGDPALVSKMGCALIEGLQSQRVAACAKHFPGHGDTDLDSHYDLPALSHDMKRLREIELPPFEAAIGAGVASIMSAHVIFRAVDPEYPATMSRRVIGGILRDQMKFDGVVFSDDLEMKAIADHFGVENAVVRAVNAGVDVMLVCHDAAVQNRAIDALVSAVRLGDVSLDQLDEAGRRIDRLMHRFA